MERKIGEIFEIGDVWYQFVKDDANGCNSCVFQMGGKCSNPEDGVKCGSWQRLDKRDGHFVRLLPIGDVYEQGGATWQQYKCVEKPNTEDKRVYIANTGSSLGLIVSIRLTSLNDMENNEKHSNSENIGKNLKPFFLEAAKAGKPVCTRDGRKARIICFDRKDIKPIVALVTFVNDTSVIEKAFYYFEDGYHLSKNDKNIYDLMMLPEKKEGWVNVYRDEESKRVYCGEFIFSEREKAEKHYECNDTKVATVPVNWEE